MRALVNDNGATVLAPCEVLERLPGNRVRVKVLGGERVISAVYLSPEPSPAASALDLCNCCEAEPAEPGPAGYCRACREAAREGTLCWHDEAPR